MLCYAGMTREDSGNYSCEVRGPQSVLLANVTHRVFVIGLLLTFYPRVALPARVLAMALCLSVCHKSQFYRNGRAHRAGFFLVRELPSSYSMLRYKKIRVSPKVRALRSGTLSYTPGLENFTTTHRSSKRVINLARQRWTL